jgi:DUF4097 and DUF4098 domain-containing protein YvlB
VRVDAVKRAASQELLRDAQIRVEASGDSIRIETEYPEHSWRHREGERRENPASVEYTLSVPRGARLDEVNLINGALNLEGLTGSISASSVNGRVTARALSGAVKLSAVNGKIDAAFENLGGANNISLSAVNGSIQLTIPSDSNAVIKANTVHGQISNDFNLPVRKGEYVGSDLEGQLGNGGPRIKLSNVNGTISIRHAQDGRPMSPVRNLLSETRGDEDSDDNGETEDDDISDSAKEVARAARQASREAAREIRRAQLEAERARRSVERDLEINEDRIEHDANEKVKEKLKEQVVVGGGDAARRIERESNTLAASGTPRVRIENFDGPITIHGWDKPEVSYTAIKRAFDDNEMKGIRVHTRGQNSQRTVRDDGGQTTSSASSEISIRAEFDKAYARRVVERAGRVVSFNSAASVELDVYVPRNAMLVVSSGDGRLRVEGVSGDIELKTNDGGIDVTGGRGRLRANTGDGRIRVEDFDGEAEAVTGDGRISLEGRFNRLSAHTGDGTISLALAEGVNATLETHAASVVNDGLAVAMNPEDAEKTVRRWRIGGGGAALFTLHTGGGQIILRRR